MAEQYIALVSDAGNTGKKIRVVENTVSATTVEQQVVTLANSAAVLSDTKAGAHYFALTDLTNGPAAIKAASTQAVAADPALVVRPMMPTDGTNPTVVKAASTAAAATDASLVVSLSPNTPPVAEFLAYASLPALTTGQMASLQCDIAGNLKVGVCALGTPIYSSVNQGAATATTVTLTCPASQMLFLDGFDLDGLGATAGNAIAVVVTGLLGGSATFEVGIPAGISAPFTYNKRFNPPLQASAAHTNITIQVPSYGSGNTAASSFAFGHSF